MRVREISTALNKLTQEAPHDLTALEYARHLLEEVLGWPAKGNLELMADCVTAVSKAKRIPLPKAHHYLERAIGLAREQGIEIDRFWFQYGSYTKVRPVRNAVNYYDREDELRNRWLAHGCNSGWLYTEKGVVRCPKCKEAMDAEKGKRAGPVGNSPRK